MNDTGWVPSIHWLDFLISRTVARNSMKWDLVRRRVFRHLLGVGEFLHSKSATLPISNTYSWHSCDIPLPTLPWGWLVGFLWWQVSGHLDLRQCNRACLDQFWGWLPWLMDHIPLRHLRKIFRYTTYTEPIWSSHSPLTALGMTCSDTNDADKALKYFQTSWPLTLEQNRRVKCLG